VDIHHEIEELDRTGITVQREHHAPPVLLAWIDQHFGGAWSSEVARGGVMYARDADGFIGFVAYDSRDYSYHWLAPHAAESDMGIFGPIGVLDRVRARGFGTLLLRGAMHGLRERGYRRALIGAVGDERLEAFYIREAGATIADRFDPIPRGRRFRTTILASGSGSNFEAVAAAAADGALPLDVTALISNRAGVRVLERAKAAAIPAHVVVWDRVDESRAEYDARVLVEVATTEPELVLLLGWMHVLPEAFVDAYACLNVHPAYLPFDPLANAVTMPDGSIIPAFRGARAVDDARAAGVGWIGASLHRVGLEVDRGAILARAPLRLDPKEPRAALDRRLHDLERQVVAAGIRRWAWEQT
jgi:phosphoribosylglycinamide formyltransferase-1